MVKTISAEKALNLKDAFFIDTRTPKEFSKDNIPGSINYPIFSDEERRIIGTLYKQNQDKAFEEGLKIYESKVANFIEEYKKLNPKNPIIVYCWRGGLRSETITKLIDGLGYDVYQLIGGHKAYRALVREGLQTYKPPFKLIVLQGLAGCGKTDLIKAITPSIDLEDLAGHRSSLFGAIGLNPCTQKMFESKLWEVLQKLKNEKVVFIEGEAKKIGDIYIPNNLFEVMKKSSIVEIQTPIKQRVKRIVRDYFTHDEDKQIKEIILKLKIQLSNKAVERLHQLVDKKDYEPVAEHLLVNYYDDLYNHANKNIKYAYTIKNNSIVKAVEELQKFAKQKDNLR
ncbi:MAG: tRNA 2-selenouridine(34) synthase MnmH [Nanoarchaeota archaeon]|nr:tRNA 2-selenouridine(34) synthase MnmH [Nanoarchaeota archaeon]MBU1030887.1 tRNA 2-selenouridine(34) synthase MnmH [Nanoarchaeota archaeon]MBU1849449.1 tRNA 2-selenouridine(34) synthase MnmH [Nanoarchaeota archaeon]